MNVEWLFSIHLAATAVMTGVIWFVQRIQYPFFHEVPEEKFPEYHRVYAQRIGWIVGPAMMVELFTGAVLLMFVEGTSRLALAGGMVLLAFIWISTFLLQVPCHHQLSRGYDAPAHRRLVGTNWIRTVAWSMRLLLLLAWMPGI